MQNFSWYDKILKITVIIEISCTRRKKEKISKTVILEISAVTTKFYQIWFSRKFPVQEERRRKFQIGNYGKFQMM
jgi:hypothetical protein